MTDTPTPRADRLAGQNVATRQRVVGSAGWYRAEAVHRARNLSPAARRDLERLLDVAGIDRPEVMPPRAQMTLVWLLDFDVLDGVLQLLQTTRDAAFALGWATLRSLEHGENLGVGGAA